MKSVQVKSTRPADSEPGCTIGVDVGGSFTKAVILGSNGEELYFDTQPTKTDGVPGFSGFLNELVTGLHSRAGDQGLEVGAIGIGVPGIVSDNRITGGIDNLSFLTGERIDSYLDVAAVIPVAIENDAFLMAVAESELGAGKGSRDVVFMTVGTGIGGAFKLGGEIYRGWTFTAGEIGNMLVLKSASGGEGFEPLRFEELASVSAMLDYYRELPGTAGAQPELTGASIIQEHLDGNSQASDALEWHYANIAVGVASLVNILGPERVVVGGGLVEVGDFYTRELQHRVSDLVMTDSLRSVEIVKAHLGNKAGCFGAALHAQEQVIKNRKVS